MALKSTTSQDLTESIPSGVAFQEIFVIILVLLAGILFAVNLLPSWLPGLSFSAVGDQPKIFWFVSRGAAMAAYWILWLSMSSGIIITNKMAQIWPGIPPSYEIHQYTSLLGLGLGLLHAMILMGDHYIHYNLFQVLVPFASQNYRPIWVGVGQTSLYLWVIVNLSFFVRRRIGKKTWRFVHFASYASFLGVMVHGIYSGTDTTAVWTQYLYWFSGASILLLTVYRILNSLIVPQNSRAKRVTQP